MCGFGKHKKGTLFYVRQNIIYLFKREGILNKIPLHVLKRQNKKRDNILALLL